MTPDEEAQYRAEAREHNLRMHILEEEWRRAQGFPYWPRWVFPVLVAVICVVAFGGGLLLSLLLARN